MSTRADLRTQIIARANMETCNFGTDTTELNSNMAHSFRRAWDLIIAAHEDYTLKVTSPFTLTTSVNYVDLSSSVATDFYKPRILERLDGTVYNKVEYFNVANKDYVVGPAYMLYGVGPTLRVEPADEAEGTYRLWYLYLPAWPSSDTPAIPDINGLVEQFIIADCAAKLKDKEESDPSLLISERDNVAAMIAKMAPGRHESRNPVILNRQRFNPAKRFVY